MKHRLKIANRHVSAVGVGTGVVIAHVANKWIIKSEVPDSILVIVAVIIIVVTTELLRFLFDSCLLNWPPIRRLILGRYYVEGTWLDRMKKDNKMIAIGVTRIQADDQSIMISGGDESEDGATGRYNTELHSLGWPCVGYMYRYSRSDADNTASGLVEMQFEPRGGPPKRYSGDYLDPTDGRKISFEGWRIEDPDLLRELDDPVERKKAIRLFWERVDAAHKTPPEGDDAEVLS